jgi:ribonuclease T1
MIRLRSLPALLAALLLPVFVAGVSPPVQAREQAATTTAVLEEVALEDLPVQAGRTVALIRRGGPFPYRKDGTIFGNRERLLPPKRRGYYTEYTVPTPSARDRGARRIVAGGDPVHSEELYYTDDHYASFRKIRDPMQ